MSDHQDSPFEIKQVNGTMTLDFKRLNRKTERKLINLLRKSFLYQTPKGEFTDPEHKHPSIMHLRMPAEHWKEMMQIISKAGGWSLPREEREKLEAVEKDRIEREKDILGNPIECPGNDCNKMALITGLFTAECDHCGGRFKSTEALDAA